MEVGEYLLATKGVEVGEVTMGIPQPHGEPTLEDRGEPAKEGEQLGVEVRPGSSYSVTKGVDLGLV